MNVFILVQNTGKVLPAVFKKSAVFNVIHASSHTQSQKCTTGFLKKDTKKEKTKILSNKIFHIKNCYGTIQLF